MIAERTGRTLAELQEMDAGEWDLWAALITRVEPAEEKKRAEEMKRNQKKR